MLQQSLKIPWTTTKTWLNKYINKNKQIFKSFCTAKQTINKKETRNERKYLQKMQLSHHVYFCNLCLFHFSDGGDNSSPACLHYNIATAPLKMGLLAIPWVRAGLLVFFDQQHLRSRGNDSRFKRLARVFFFFFPSLRWWY